MTGISKVPIGNVGQTYQSESTPAQTQQVSLEGKPDTVTLSAKKSQKNVFPAILSFFIPGAGQVMNDESGKGVKYFLTAAAIGATSVIAATKSWAMQAANSNFLFNKRSEAIDAAFKAKAQASQEALHQGTKAFKANMANNSGWLQEAEAVGRAATEKASKELPHSLGKIRTLGVVASIASLASLATHVFSAKDAYDGKQT